MTETHTHFDGKSALDHVTEKRQEGELHGEGAATYLSSGCDAMKETTVSLGLLWIVMTSFGFSAAVIFTVATTYALGYIVWKVCRSAYNGWSRLERLHRVIEQERFEIEHHRPQERDELEALYAQKGFEGKLLEEVVDHLMADNDRLLRVMLEEEMGLTLEVYDHPLKQAVGSCLGALLSLTIIACGFLISGVWATLVTIGCAMVIPTIIHARAEGNKVVPACVWSLGIVTLSLLIGKFSLQFILRALGVLG